MKALATSAGSVMGTVLPDWLAVAGVLAVAYLVGRFAAWLVGLVVLRSARRRQATLDPDLVPGLKRPLAWAVFLFGATIGALELPVHDPWPARAARFALALSLGFGSVALLQAWMLFVGWYGAARERTHKGWTESLAPILQKMGALVIGTIGFITVLQTFGIDVSSLLVSLGVGSLAIGLAAQDTLANLFAGFALLMDRPFKVGDRVQLASGEIGDVTAIGLRATRIKTQDETLLVVPNSVLTKDRVVNQSEPSRAVTTRIEVGVAYGSDLGRAKAVLAESALASSRIDASRAPVVLVVRFAELAVQLRLVFWVKDYLEQGLASTEVHEEIYRRLAEAGIEIPVAAPLSLREKISAAPAGKGANISTEGPMAKEAP